jgi:hypothetical protein
MVRYVLLWPLRPELDGQDPFGMNTKKDNFCLMPPIVKCKAFYMSAFLVLKGHFNLFWTDIFWTIYKKAGPQQKLSESISLLLLLCHVSTNSKSSQITFALSTGVLFASNDSKTSFEQRKNALWTVNWDDSLKTNIWPQRTIFRPQQSNCVCSNDKFVGDMGQCNVPPKLLFLQYCEFPPNFLNWQWKALKILFLHENSYALTGLAVMI